jgi:Domain of unknown function (DUF4249)
MGRVFAVVALAVCAGCELVREPTALEFDRDYIVVHALLEAGAARAAVLITRATPSDIPYEPHRSEPIAGATVRLSTAGQDLLLEPDPLQPEACGAQSLPHPSLDPGCYLSQVPGAIQVGATYALEITLPGGGVVTGSATIPLSPVVHTDDDQPRLHITRFGPNDEQPPVGLRLDPLPSTPLVAIAVRLERSDCFVPIYTDDELPSSYLPATGDRAEVRANGIFCTREIEAGDYPADLRVFRYDDVYSAYTGSIGDESVPVEDLSYGLAGAAGVFAGAAVVDVPITVVVRNSN